MTLAADCARHAARERVGIGRKPAVADRGLGRLNWAGSPLPSAPQEGPESAPKRPFRCKREARFTEAEVPPELKMEAARDRCAPPAILL
jgi:hypothetical protein